MKGLQGIIFILTLLNVTHLVSCQGYLPQVTPFFFLCNYHGNVQDVGRQGGEVKLSVSIEGNPDNYIPGQVYQVTVSSSLNFDGFLLTGLYTITNLALTQIPTLGIQANQPVGQNLMCSIVHSHMSSEPVHEFQFIWIAPPVGTGCVSFLATATLHSQLLFKDTTVLQLCEEGAPTSAPLRPLLAELHSDAVIFRDDFDSYESFSPEHWSSHEGASVGQTCGSILYGDAAVMCEKSGYRELITNPLNTTSAAVLQFTIGAGTCGSGNKKDQLITVSFGTNGCQDWHEMESIRPPKEGKKAEVHILHILPQAREVGICFAWRQPPTVPKLPAKPTTTVNPSTAKVNVYGMAGLADSMTDHSEHHMTTESPVTTESHATTESHMTTESHDDVPATSESFGFPNIVHDEPPQEDSPADDIAYSDAKFGPKTKSKKGTKGLVYRPGGRSFGVDRFADEGTGTYQGCWALDHVIVINTAHLPGKMEDSFDPVDPSDWLMFPGAQFKQHCHSDNTVMVFDHNSSVVAAVTRDLDLTPADFTADVILEENFESKHQPGWEIIGGHVDTSCGIIHQANSMVFDGDRKKRKICSPLFDSRKAGNLRFYFALGSGGCHNSGNPKAEVMVFVEDDNEQTLYIIEKLNINSYLEPRLVSLPLNPTEHRQMTRVCWLQKFSQGQGHNVWAIDDIQILTRLPENAVQNKDKVLQFNINLQCGNNPEDNEVQVSFSTNHGETWHVLHTPCLPGQCVGLHFPVDSVYHAVDFDSWRRVTVPVPYVAMVPSVRFKWEKMSSDDPNWAMDNVFIGDCVEGCSGHGTCSEGACRCDFGFTGSSCKKPVVPNPTILLENFEGPGLVTSSTVDHIDGASLGYQCDVLSSGKAVVFNQEGHRELVTAELNTTDNMYLQFHIRVGSNSPVSECPPPDETKKLVILDFSCDGGISWHLLKTFSIQDYRTPQSDSVMLPEAARDSGCKFRWWQPAHSGLGRDVWALDDLSLNDHMFNTLHLEMGKLVDIGERLTVTHGKLSDSYCRKMKSLSFVGEHEYDEFRFFTTESMHIAPGYIVQFELVMGCGLPYSENLDNRLYLEFSSDHGIHWSLVEDPCLPPTACDTVKQGTIYDWTQYPEWTRVTVPLPPATWGPSTRFRMRQSYWGPTDTWGIARLYIGQRCPDMCTGHGECREGICLCDDGFEGESCWPVWKLDDRMQADFGFRYEPKLDFLHVRGGKVVSNNQGCGNIKSGESMYFYDDGVRELISQDKDTTRSDYLNFYLRIGGGDKDCNGGEERSEGVILQYSNDGGVSWKVLGEQLHTQYGKPRLVAVDLPPEAKTPSTRFRWWQPSHSGKGYDQWAVDDIMLGKYAHLRSLEDDFDTSVDPLDSGLWLTTSDGMIGKYCNSGNPTLIMANQQHDKFIVTKDLVLQPGDVIQFKINVGCSDQFRWDHPVMFQYWTRGGQGFRLVQESCYQDMECDGNHREGSIYYAGPHGHWELVVIPVTEELAKHPVMFRWWQPGGYPYNFALNDVYIGPPCTDNCHRYGACKQGRCVCDQNSEDMNCQSDDPTPYGMLDRFEQLHRPSDFWRRTLGGHLGLSCGPVDSGNALMVDGEGTREAVTVLLNTTHLRMLEFVLKIGSRDQSHRCTQAESRNEGIIVDFSTDNEITWQPLKLVEPLLYNGTLEHVLLELPSEAKTDRTIFRWWQPLGYGGMKRAEWGLDSVTVGVNDTNLKGFQEDFAGMMPDMFTWFQTESAVPRITCDSKGNALEFSRNGGQRYAETWDYHVTPSTFLQFDIAMNCDSLYGTLYGVNLEYSTDMGKHWQPVASKCAPPNFECSGYQLSSDYMSDQHKNWTRVSVYLPQSARGPATRFRWQQDSPAPIWQQDSPSADVWALDNVYLGDGCPWLCSGHGYCVKGRCVCDEGFTGEYCVPSKPLPMMLRDDFNREKPLNENWKEVYGGELTTMCGTLVSGNALTFSGDHLRMIVSHDIDTSMLNTVEFYFLYGCNGKEMSWPRKESVLLQYSTNGGITWNVLQELHYRNESAPRFFSLELPMKARYNATRFRFWQPANSGKMLSTWAVDNLFIGRTTMNPSTMQDNFENDVQSDSWLFVNDGVVGSYCQQNVREDSMAAGGSALVFKHGPDSGEHYVVTRDLDVGPMSVLQFDINVGCASDATNKYPVRLEYSSNGGKTWSLVAPNCAEKSYALCYDSVLHPSIYYGGATKYWRRIVIPLDSIYVCGSLRFRWYQGFIPDDDFAPEWAIDNVFIGMACMQHCLGQGHCGDTMMCTCDPGFHGDTCTPSQSYPNYMKEGFPLADTVPLPDSLPALDTFVKPEKLLDEKRWYMWSGGEVSKKCGLLVDGYSLMFDHLGERSLVTTELDLSKATTVQFYLRLGCSKTPPDPATPPVYLQYTTNGGVNWFTVEQFDFNLHSNQPEYIVLHLPERSRSPASQLRWWQPSKDGTFMEPWAIDQIYVGGDFEGLEMLADDPGAPRDPTWTMNPGGIIEKKCEAEFDAMHYKGEEKHRFGVTADVSVTEGTLLQFQLEMGCVSPKNCFKIDLDYSLDMGSTWTHVFKACKPSDMNCNKLYYPDSTFSSEYHWQWHRVNVPLPHYTRSKATRFRIYQHEGYDNADTWAMADLYIGNHCPSWCHGHGKCTETGCICDEGWEGESCSTPTTKLKTYAYEMFSDDTKEWLKYVGGKPSSACQVLASGPALHFTGNCSRGVQTQFLDLTSAAFVQFNFMYGCHSPPDNLDESVLISFTTDDVIYTNIGLLYYRNYRNPTFVTMKLPLEARQNGTRISLWQMEHSGENEDDWAIDNLRVGGNLVNPDSLVANDFFNGFDPEDWSTFDNMAADDYCDELDVAIGNTLAKEKSSLTTRDLAVKAGHMIQFSYNIGCMRPWNVTVAPIHLQYSTDYGVTWSYLTPQCLPNDPACPKGASMASVYYGDPMGRWQRVILPLEDMALSGSTRFRWQQQPIDNFEAITDWGIKDVYIGPQCDRMCRGHGNCHYPACSCDKGYVGSECYAWTANNPSQLKDVFDIPLLDKTKWSLVEGGAIQDPCSTLVEETALVMSGQGMRQVVTVDMDLRDAKFVQYVATIGGYGDHPGCFKPYTRDQSVILQYSTDGGISWHTLHTLDYTSYLKPRRDYIKLPQAARTSSTRVRWWQPLAEPRSRLQPTWALDNVFIGGNEINPALYQINFNETLMISDQPWEFNPFGKIQTEFCKKDDIVILWEEGKGTRLFTTKQMIVQTDYILQFKIAVGCSKTYNACESLTPVLLQYNKDPFADKWLEVIPLCLPDLNQRMDCRPNMYHYASQYTPDTYPGWTRVTISLPEKTFSSTTRFRWIQDSPEEAAPGWALDDIYVGESCPDMCHGRGHCKYGMCHCDEGYSGPSCMPVRQQLTKMFDSFEGGVFTTHWDWVSGGGIGFGCGALLPYAHGKTLYFNGCGLRMARTVEMDLSRASKVMFVLQIGCQDQTPDCNIKTGSQSEYHGVLLQYTTNRGADWHLIARHDTADYLRPKRLAYDIPSAAKTKGVQFRWWQPVHGGEGHDQWAMDHVEIVPGRNGMKFYRRRRRYVGADRL